jgi:ABC-type bacteriocin/lantibiotic exporter with double-glycine peptidase domain
MTQIFSLFRLLFSGNGWRLLFLGVVIYLVALYSLVLPLLFALAIDVLLPQGLSIHLVAVICAALILALLRFCLAFTQDYEFQRLRMRSETSIMQRILANVIARPDNDSTGIDSWLRLWLVNFQYQMTEILFFCAYALMISATVLVLIFWIDIWVGIIVACFSLIHYGNFRYHSPKSRACSDRYGVAKTAFVGAISSAVRSKRAINVAQLDQQIGNALHDKAAAAFLAECDKAHISASQALVQSILRGLQYLALVAYCAPQILSGEMTVGSMFFVLLLVSFAYEPVYRLNQITAMANQLLANLAPLRPLLDNDIQPLQKNDHLPSHAPIQLFELSHKLGEFRLFPPMSLTLEPGRIYLVKGASGSGKSCLLDLISGLQTPSDGMVQWAGSDMRTHRGGVFISRQSPHIFETSVADNISLFEVEPDRASIERLLKKVGLDRIADNIDAAIAPEALSLGEGQRIALARALYQKPLFLLLDEPTANLDRSTEKLCLNAIAANKAGRITVLVSHSDQAEWIADAIVSMDDANGTKHIN